MKNTAISLILGFSLFTNSLSQVTQPPPPPDEDKSVVKISTDLIQIDVSVTDKKGKIVSDLKLDDFEIFENGEKQSISNFGFVSRTASAATVDGSMSRSSAQPQPASAEKRPQTPATVRRTIAIVVDDLNLSFGSVHLARKALQKFVDEQMEPDDLVAIIRTRGGTGSLQQFTSDKKILHMAIDSLRWNPNGGGFDSLTPIAQNDSDISERFRRESDLVAGGATKTQTIVLDKDFGHDKKGADVSRNSNSQEAGLYAQTSLGAIKYVVAGMKGLPGRKAMMLFSDGIEVGNDSVKERGSTIYGYLQDIADIANRSSVVVYTFDTKGMRSMSIGASDSTYEIIDGHRGQKETVRLKDFRDSQDGLVYFANRTGGRAFLNSDNLNYGIQRALDEQAGYYLLAYIPSAENFDPEKRRFNKLEIKVKRPGLDVSYRSGFFSGGAGEVSSKVASERSLANALLSPFTQNDIVLNMNALYADDKADGPYVRAFLHIDARNLTFTDDPSGWKKATFDILAAAFDGNGSPFENKESQYSIKTRGATYEAMLERGFVYVLPVPIKKPGLYQFRVAIRDAESGKIGSAYQIIDVPDLSKRELVLSSLAVENVSAQTWQSISSGKVGTSTGQVQLPSTLLYDTVLRRFRAGSILRYGYELYESAQGSSTPELETRASIYRNDAAVFEGSLNKINISKQKDRHRIRVSGALTIPDSLPPGDYLLRVAVFDRTANKVATQILPFEVLK